MNIRDRNPLLLGVVAVFALGVGITGTLLWQQENAPLSARAGAAPTSTSAPTPNSTSISTGPSETSPLVPPPAQLANAQQALSQANEYYDAGQWARAVERYKFVITSGFDNPDVRTDMGNALRFDGKPQLALEQYQIAQSQDPTHEQSLFNQGGLWAFALHNTAKGVEVWQAYLKRFPKGHSANDARAFIKKYQHK